MTSLFKFLFSQTPTDYAQGKWVNTSSLPGELRLLICIAAIGVLYWLYRKSSATMSKGIARLLFGLRCAVIGILLIILGAPALRLFDESKDKKFVAVLLDQSRSMSINDVKGATRFDAARNAVKSLAPELANDAQVVVYGFADDARRAPALDGLAPDGARTDFFQSIKGVDADLRNVPLSGVVLLSDGAHNTGGTTTDAARLLEARGVSLYTVGVGDAVAPRDREVVQVLAPAVVPVGTQVDADVTVRYTGLDKPFDLILKRNEQVVLTKTITPEAGTDLQRVHLTFTPDVQGAAAYHVEIPVSPDESIKENNARDFLVQVKDDRLPVLYIEGSPRMEYRFMRRALFRDPTFRLVGQLRLANDRFYLQPAEPDLDKGFPTSMEVLSRFKAVILGDIEANFFTPEQQQMLEDFVKQRGGGLLMLGGVNSFGPGGYANSPIARALPLVMSPGDQNYSDQQFSGLAITKSLDHPVMRLSLDPTENKILWDNAPQLIGLTPTQGVKPGATLLIEKPDTKQPVLAVQNYGLGRAAAFTSGGSWYWQVSRPSSEEFHAKFWKQLVRWLAVGAQDLLTVTTDASVYSRRDPVNIVATVMGKDLRPLNDAKVTASVTDALGNTQQIPMDWILAEEGVYQCRLNPDALGQYSVKVQVEGWTSAPAEASFVVSESSAEFADAAMKRDALQQMAVNTKGQYFDLDQAGGVVAAIRENIKKTTQASQNKIDKPIWDAPILLILIIALLSAEWLIRRRNGLS